jgi:hypothetical protein
MGDDDMSPFDRRHGTEAGYRAHRRAGQDACDACLEGNRKLNTLRQLYPDRYRKIPNVGTRRRIHALQAIGYSRAVIAAEAGYGNGGSIAYICKPASKAVTQSTYWKIRETYERLCMTVPQSDDAKKVRTWAKRHGYAPPLAWDDIDDPNEQPNTDARDLQREHGRPVSWRLDEYEWLLSQGESHEQALAQLGITEAAINRARARAAQRDGEAA